MIKLVAIALIAISVVASVNAEEAMVPCAPACEGVCSEINGTCCCPFPETYYPTSGVGNYHSLTSYKLSSTREAQFSDSDKLVSPFWYAWDADTIWDFIELSPEYKGNTWIQSFEGMHTAEDAHMEVRSVWSDKGLYLFFLVNDDEFVEMSDKCDEGGCSANANLWGRDAVDMVLDQNPLVVLNTESSVYYRPESDRVTRSMVQFQRRFGKDSTVTAFSINRSQPNDFAYNWSVSLSLAKDSLNGLTSESIIIDRNTRAQEWFIPWSQIGRDGIAEPNPPQGQPSIAACLGYNDFDPGAQSFDALRWRNAADPFKRVPPPKGFGPHVPTEPWSEIVFSSSEVSTRTPQFQRRGRRLTPSGDEQFFDIRGCRITANVAPGRRSPTGVVVRSTRSASGQTTAQSHLLVR